MSEFVVESITELFHLVKSLIPEDQDLVCIKPGTTVAEAVQIMQRHHYSQLPIIEGQTVLGIFSYRSLSTRLLRMGNIKAYVGDLPVDEFVEQFNFVQLSDNWEHILSAINKDDAVLVGGHEQLNGLVTTMDVLTYLRKVASPFVLMAEIEMTLRRVIRACVSEEELQICAAKGLASKYASADDVPTDLTEMEFNDYAQIIGNRENWPHFAVVFGETDWSRSSTTQKLHQIRRLRNDVFHFKRKIEQQDLQQLTEFRDWLQLKARTFEARRNSSQKDNSPAYKLRAVKYRVAEPSFAKALAENQTEEEVYKVHATKDGWDEPSFFRALAENKSQHEVLVAQKILVWSKQHLPEIWWGQGEVYGCFIPGFTHQNTWHQIIGVWTYGSVEIQLQYMRGRPVFDTDQKQRELIQRLNHISSVSIKETQVGKRPSIPLSTLAEDQALNGFFGVLKWFVDTIRATSGQPGRRVLRYQFWSKLLDEAREMSSIHANISPSRDNWISASSGLRGVAYNYAIRMQDARIELYIDRGNKFENEQVFNALLAKKDEIEQRFGEPLEWLLMKDKQTCIIRHMIEDQGGSRDQTTWPNLRKHMIEAMVRFSEAIQPEINQISL